MARSITLDREETKTSFGIARREDVNYDDVKKRWMESADKMELPQDPRTQEEIQAAEDFSVAAGFADFFEFEGVEISEGDAQETMVKMAAMMEAEAQDEIQLAQEQRARNIEEDAAEKIEQVEVFVVNEDDPLLEKDFKEKSEKIIQKWAMEDKKKDGTYEPTKEDVDKKWQTTSSSSDPWPSSSNRTRTATATSTTTSGTGTIYDDGQRNKEIHQMYSNMHDNILNTVHNGPVWKEEKKATPVNHFGGKKKFSMKSIWTSVKGWFKSKKSKAICKIGVALCMETALGIITKRQSFDGPGQMLGYLGMMLGVFFIGSELRAEGYDMRRLSVI